jgi:ferredoxin--NADP+ reductase
MTPNPIRIAIIGSGPSAFYTAGHLLKAQPDTLEIDMFEHLPTPFGLVRGGVAPDHPRIKSVTRIYDKTAEHPNFRFYGNVTFGQDLTHAEIFDYYHAVIYAVGAQTDRHLNIPGVDLPNSHAATEFIAWYNGHPDYADREFDLSQEHAVVIGNGNVAMDVARILASSREELHRTDIADYALDALANSGIKTITVLGRRGPVQAKFTNPEIKELGELAEADVIVNPDDLVLDPLSQDYLDEGSDRAAVRNYATLQEYAAQTPNGSARKVYMRFLVSPTEVHGTDRTEQITVVHNEICEKQHMLSPCPTDETETIPAGLVFRSIGYRGVPLSGVPFDEKQGIIPNDRGRVLNGDQQPIPGEYAVGWIKRGPTGIIGTNKPDGQETSDMLLADLARGDLRQPTTPDRTAIETLLRNRGVRYVSYDDWRILDRLEIERGQAIGRPRVKFTHVAEMLAALEAVTAAQA